MANCANCNAPLADGARFCANCGAAVVPEEATSFAPVDPPPAPEAPSPAPEAPSFVPEAPSFAPEAPSFTPEAPSPAFDPAPVAGTDFCPSCGASVDSGTDYCEHCGAPLNGGGVQPKKTAGGSGLKKWIILGGGVLVVAAIVVVLILVLGGGGGKGYGLYIKDKDLYYSNLSKNGAWQASGKLYEDGENRDFAHNSYYIYSRTAMSKDGKTMFFPDRLSSLGYGDFTLYYRGTASEKKEAVKIDSGITRYAVSDNAGLVTYLKNSNLYQYNMNRDEKEKLAGDIYIFYVSDDGKKIIYLDEDDTLYQLDSGKEKVRLDSDVDYIESISDDCKTVIYMKGGDTLYLKQDGKDKVKIASDVYNTISAYDTGEAYYIKDDDDYTLYYFDGKDNTELTDEYEDWYGIGGETAMLVFQDVDEAYWLAVGGKTMELNAEEPFNFVFSKDGKSVWYVDEPDRNREGELYQITISNGTPQKAAKQDTDVYADYIASTSEGHLIYFKDVSDYEGELWVDGKKADDDVYLYSLSESESGALSYLTDYNSSKGYGTLKQYSGGKAAKVEDDVSQAYYMPNGSILYLADYSSSRYRGDLYVYSGGKSTQLDEDVITIIPVSDSKYKG